MSFMMFYLYIYLKSRISVLFKDKYVIGVCAIKGLHTLCSKFLYIYIYILVSQI